MSKINILCIGDIVGKAGRDVLNSSLESIQEEHQIDFTIANLENAANGIGITPKIYKELSKLPIQGFTSGNHIFDKREIIPIFNELPNVIRPLNFPTSNPGKGFMTFNYNGIRISIVNLIGQVFMRPYNSPFEAINQLLSKENFSEDIVIVDFHKEATSEVLAMGYHLDGKISALYGTHTHVQTADERILENGTGYISDLGMTGSENSILGMKKDGIISQFITNIHARKEPSTKYPYMINAIVFTIDLKSKKTTNVKRLYNRYYGFDDM